MEFTIKELETKDFGKAIQFAIQGMHFHMYVDSPVLLNLYGKYFLYMELLRATQIIAVYEEDELLGLLLADVKGEPKKYHSFWKQLYVKSIELLMHVFAGSAGAYDEINRKMFEKYKQNGSPDGEIGFLAAKPNSGKKGIGTMLIDELERREPGKEFFLYTDSGCTYQFYEHRGFERRERRKAKFTLGKKSLTLQCFLYVRKFGETL